MTTFASLPLGANFEHEGSRWMKTDVQRGKPCNGPGPSYLFFGPAEVKAVQRPEATDKTKGAFGATQEG